MTPNLLRSVLVAAATLAPAAALAQYLAPEPAVIPEPLIVAEPPVLALAPAGPLTEQDAADIAMMNGMVVIEDIGHRIWDGNFEVEGTDPAGEDIVMVIDHDTGDILEIDD